MNKMNEILRALDEIVTCGEGLLKAIKTLREIFAEEPVPALPTQTEQPAALPEKKYTFTEVRKAFSAKSKAGYTDQVKALITRYGADKLSAVKEEDYTAIMADLEAIE